MPDDPLEPIADLSADEEFNHRAGNSLATLVNKITANQAALSERLINLGRLADMLFEFFREAGAMPKLPQFVAQQWGWSINYFHALRRAAELFKPDDVATITPEALLALSAADVPDSVIEECRMLARHRVVTRLQVHRLVTNHRDQLARRQAGRLHEDERPPPRDFDARNPRNRL